MKKNATTLLPPGRNSKDYWDDFFFANCGSNDSHDLIPE